MLDNYRHKLVGEQYTDIHLPHTHEFIPFSLSLGTIVNGLEDSWTVVEYLKLWYQVRTDALIKAVSAHDFPSHVRPLIIGTWFYVEFSACILLAQNTVTGNVWAFVGEFPLFMVVPKDRPYRARWGFFYARQNWHCRHWQAQRNWRAEFRSSPNPCFALKKSTFEFFSWNPLYGHYIYILFLGLLAARVWIQSKDATYQTVHAKLSKSSYGITKILHKKVPFFIITRTWF